MADNYLEKKMEEHRRGGAPSYRPRLTPRGRRVGELVVEFPPVKVVVDDGATSVGQAIVGEFAANGCRVAFCDVDSRRGAATAQKTGARFYPVSQFPEGNISDGLVLRVCDDWGGVDLVIRTNCERQDGLAVCRISAGDVCRTICYDPALQGIECQVARFCVLMSIPSSMCCRNMDLTIR